MIELVSLFLIHATLETKLIVIIDLLMFLNRYKVCFQMSFTVCHFTFFTIFFFNFGIVINQLSSFIVSMTFTNCS